MPITGDNIDRDSEPNSEGKRFKRAKPNPTMPATTPITEGTINSKVWSEISKKLDTLKILKSPRKKPE